ncbi:MAG: hypothetical protein Q8R37_01240 [Nanoarchaeota archaeon]|nr:hypothetical protein [Nanoarchaeota archaeon]
MLLLAIPPALAIGLSGKSLSPIIYVPGKNIINHYFVTDTSLPVQISVGGDLSQYITLTPLLNNEFDLIIQFPEEFIPVGTYSFSLSATEIAQDVSPGIGSLTSVSKRIIVEAYSFDKEITASLSAPSVNENGTVHFTVNVESRTYSDINSINAKIVITDAENATLGEVRTNTKALPALAVETLAASFNTTGLRPSQYHARAYVQFDGRQKIADATFRIGTMDLLLLNYTAVLEQGFSTFQAMVFNNWGNELRNVYAKLLLPELSENQLLLQTPSIDLGPWQEGVLEGITKIDLPEGEYNGILQLLFEGEQKEEPLPFTVVQVISPEKIKADIELSRRNMIIQLLAIGVLVLIVCVLFLLKRTSQRKLTLPLAQAHREEL